jgi:hypothetical protein
MSETNDVESLGRRVLEKSRTSPLRDRMTAFVDEHRPVPDLDAIRGDTGSRGSMADAVIEGRDERL